MNNLELELTDIITGINISDVPKSFENRYVNKINSTLHSQITSLHSKLLESGLKEPVSQLTFNCLPEFEKIEEIEKKKPKDYHKKLLNYFCLILLPFLKNNFTVNNPIVVRHNRNDILWAGKNVWDMIVGVETYFNGERV